MPLIRTPREEMAPLPTIAETRAGLRAPSAEDRWSAARQLSGQPGNAALLAEALGQEKDPRVREALFTALAKDGGGDAVAAILNFVRSQDAALRTAALDVLATLPQAIAANIEKLLADPDSDVRILSCDLARRLPTAEATLLLSALLNREVVPNVCAAAVEVLCEVGDDQALPALQACAARFADVGFLRYAIQLAIRRLGKGGQPFSSALE